MNTHTSVTSLQMNNKLNLKVIRGNIVPLSPDAESSFSWLSLDDTTLMQAVFWPSLKSSIYKETYD